MKKRKFRPLQGDPSLWMVIFGLLIISLLVVYSSSVSRAYGHTKADGDASFFLYLQARFIFIGIVAMLIFHRINFRTYSPYIRSAFYLSVLLVLIAYFTGDSINDAPRWLQIPIFGSFQPSEMLKVTLVALLAVQLGKRSAIISSIPILPALTPSGWRQNRHKNRDILSYTTKPILYPIVIACVVVLLTNFSTTLLIFVVSMVVLTVAQIRRSEIRRILLVGVFGGILAVALMSLTGVGRIDTAQSRIESFANTIIGDPDDRIPIKPALGQDSESIDQRVNAVSSSLIGQESTARDSLRESAMQLMAADQKWLPTQAEHAKIAIATGGIIGKGPGNSTQRSQLPLSYSDFAYAFIVEEYGILGGVVVLVLFLWVFYRSGVIIRHCRNTTNALLVLGLSLTITFQALINMMVCVGLGPVTGQPLPLVSMGGSSVLFTCIAFGMILSVSRQNDQEDAQEALLLRQAQLDEQPQGEYSNQPENLEYGLDGEAADEVSRNFPLNSTASTQEPVQTPVQTPVQHPAQAPVQRSGQALADASAAPGRASQQQNPPRQVDDTDDDMPFVVVDRNNPSDQTPDSPQSRNVIDLYE